MKINNLSHDLTEKLGYYVYIYINPIDGQVFYVGKGVGSRCLSHLSDTSESRKVETIQAIRAAGLEPRIDILVHGLQDELSALKIEAAVIDLIGKENLTNKVRGYESGVFGRTPLDELIAIFEARPVTIDGLPC